MNRKLQDLDREFIVSRYKRDPHAFNAHTEAQKYAVSVRTIHSVISGAGIKMRRGRKPLVPPEALESQESIGSPVPPLSPSSLPSDLQDTLNDAESLKALDSALFADLPNLPTSPNSSFASLWDGGFPNPSKPQSRKRKGPPAIHPPKHPPKQPPKKVSE